MEKISWKDLKRQPLINLLENYEKMVEENSTTNFSIPSIDGYLDSDNVLSDEEYVQAKVSIEDLSSAIIDEFENLLAKYNMYIPDEFREFRESEACIYGANYYELDDKIKNLLKNNI